MGSNMIHSGTNKIMEFELYTIDSKIEAQMATTNWKILCWTIS